MKSLCDSCIKYKTWSCILWKTKAPKEIFRFMVKCSDYMNKELEGED